MHLFLTFACPLLDPNKSHLFNKNPKENEVLHVSFSLQSFVLMISFGHTFQHWWKYTAVLLLAYNELCKSLPFVLIMILIMIGKRIRATALGSNRICKLQFPNYYLVEVCICSPEKWPRFTQKTKARAETTFLLQQERKTSTSGINYVNHYCNFYIVSSRGLNHLFISHRNIYSMCCVVPL